MASQRRIDTHIHILPPFWQEAAVSAGVIPTRGGFPDWSPERGIELMDAAGIDIAITSVSLPGVHFLEPAKAREMARRCNDFSAELNGRWPDRLGAFALVPMHDSKHAIEEIDYAFDVLKLDGVNLFTNYGGTYLGDPKFDPVLDALNERNAVVFIHPMQHGKIDLPYPGFMLEYTFDTTRAATHLMYSGALERFPQVRFILSHAGGSLPYLAWRLYVAPKISSKVAQWPYERILAALRRFWYDTALSAGPQMMACLFSVAGSERVVFGSDWPFATGPAVAEAVKNLSTPAFVSEAQCEAIAVGNALDLFPRIGRQPSQPSH